MNYNFYILFFNNVRVDLLILQNRCFYASNATNLKQQSKGIILFLLCDIFMFINARLTATKANIEHTFIAANENGTLLHINNHKRENVNYTTKLYILYSISGLYKVTYIP